MSIRLSVKLLLSYCFLIMSRSTALIIFKLFIFFLDFADKVPEDVREQVLMTNLLPCVKVCCYTINTEKASFTRY